jgi:hypothetical protein
MPRKRTEPVSPRLFRPRVTIPHAPAGAPTPAGGRESPALIGHVASDYGIWDCHAVGTGG